ncbi:NUDIX domain-containing protein [Candidatus Daviesbacteria bacterium]|nr:NUDIX domain-containing protein [Candidatus Daviesbacteria bacterium]
MDEQLIVVDENDNVLNYLPRKIVHDQELLHRTISVSVYNDKGEILLQKRSPKKDNNPGFWANSAGGHVTKDKDYGQTAKDEVAEELGVNPDLILIKKMKINDPVHTTMTCLYKTYSNGPFNFNKEEIDEIKFYSREDLKQVQDDLSESAKIVLKEQGLL